MAWRPLAWYNTGMKTRILKLAEPDERLEIEFELGFLASLDCEDRVRLVLERSRLLREMLDEHGHPRVSGVTKQTTSSTTRC